MIYRAAVYFFFFSSRRRHTRLQGDWSSDVCSSDLIRWGDQWPAKHDLSSLRLLGTVGEPINPEAWMWYHKKIEIGRASCRERSVDLGGRRIIKKKKSRDKSWAGE